MTSPRFTPESAAAYDALITQRVPGYELFLETCAASLAASLPDDAHVLVAGAGTGAELTRLADTRSSWRFTAVDVSAAMLDVARQKVEAAGYGSRVNFVEGDMQAFESRDTFDAATSILLSQFLGDADIKRAYYQKLADFLRPGASFFSVDCVALPDEVTLSWARLRGADQQAVEMMVAHARGGWHILSEAELAALWQEAGFAPVSRLAQALGYVATIMLRR